MYENVLSYVLAYFIGAIPFGLILTHLFTKQNILKLGSQSIGATNVYRVTKTKNKKLALMLAISTILFDILKGFLPIFIAYKFFNIGYSVLWTMGILAILGHCFSPFLNFAGGKGVATALGVGLFFLPLAVLSGVLFWVIAAKTIRISSVSSLVGMFVFGIASFVIYPDIPYIHTHAPVLILIFIVAYQHIPNIIRLFQRQETKVI